MSSILGNLFKALVPNPPGFVANTGGGAAPKTEAPAVEPPKAEVSGRPDAEALAKPEAPAPAEKAITEDTVNAPVASPVMTSTDQPKGINFNSVLMTRVAEGMQNQVSLISVKPGEKHPSLEISDLALRLEKALKGEDSGLILRNRSDTSFTANPTKELAADVARNYLARVLQPKSHEGDQVASLTQSLEPIVNLAVSGNTSAAKALVQESRWRDSVPHDHAEIPFHQAANNLLDKAVVRLATENPTILLNVADETHHGLLNLLEQLPHTTSHTVTNLLAPLGEKLLVHLQPLSKPDDISSLLRWNDAPSVGLRSAAATLLEVVKGVKTETLADMKASLITNLGKVVNHPSASLQTTNTASSKQ